MQYWRNVHDWGRVLADRMKNREEEKEKESWLSKELQSAKDSGDLNE